MLTNIPLQEMPLRLETSKSFSFRMGFMNAVGQPIDMTGAELRLTAVNLLNEEILSLAAVIEDTPENGVFRFDIQPADVNLDAGNYRYNVTLRTSQNYIVDVMMGDLELVKSPSITWVDQTYTDDGAVLTLNVVFGGGQRITVQTDDLPAPELDVAPIAMLEPGNPPMAYFTGSYPHQVLHLAFPETLGPGEIQPTAMTSTALAKVHAILAQANTKRTKVAFYGDSVTEGFSATRGTRAWVQHLTRRMQQAAPSNIYDWAPLVLSTASVNAFPNLMAQTQGVHSFNFGNFGEQANTFIGTDELNATTAVVPDIAFVAIGINDYGSNKDPLLFRDQLETAIQSIATAAGKQIPVVIVSMYPRTDGGTHDWTWDEYADAMGVVANADPEWRTFVDLRQVYKKVGTDTGDPYDIVYSDNIHLSDSGMAFTAEQIAIALQLGGGEYRMDPELYDNFKRAALGSLRTGHTWASDGTAVWAPVVTDTPYGSYLECTTAGYVLTDSLHSNIEVGAVLLNNTLGFGGLAARSDSNAQNTLLFQVGAQAVPANSAWQLLVRVAGAYTTLASGVDASIIAGRPIHLNLLANGSTVQAYINGKQVASVTLTAPQVAALTGKRVGLRASASTQNRVLSFSASPM